MTEPDEPVLTGYTLHQLRTDNSEELQHLIDEALTQVARPRYNLGGGGPPGRAD